MSSNILICIYEILSCCLWSKFSKSSLKR